MSRVLGAVHSAAEALVYKVQMTILSSYSGAEESVYAHYYQKIRCDTWAQQRIAELEAQLSGNLVNE